MLGVRVARYYPRPIRSTSTPANVERRNLSARMTNRRLARLTNAFSKKIENHTAAGGPQLLPIQFVKLHRALRTTPGMADGVTNRLWEVSDLVALWEGSERRCEAA
jgi:hypothetical protein